MKLQHAGRRAACRRAACRSSSRACSRSCRAARDAPQRVATAHDVHVRAAARRALRASTRAAARITFGGSAIGGSGNTQIRADGQRAVGSSLSSRMTSIVVLNLSREPTTVVALAHGVYGDAQALLGRAAARRSARNSFARLRSAAAGSAGRRDPSPSDGTPGSARKLLVRDAGDLRRDLADRSARASPRARSRAGSECG